MSARAPGTELLDASDSPPETQTTTGAATDAEASGETTAERSSAPSLTQRFFNVRTLLSFGLGFAIIAFLLTRVQIDVAGMLERVRHVDRHRGISYWSLIVVGLIAYPLSRKK